MNSESNQYGNGRTEEEAIADLKANFFECETRTAGLS